MKYIYECPNCKHIYQEQRSWDQPSPWFTRCNDCKEADYVDITPEETKVANAIEQEKGEAEQAEKDAAIAKYIQEMKALEDSLPE